MRKPLVLLASLLFLLVLVLTAGGIWLFGSSSGLDALARLAAASSAGRLQVVVGTGSFTGPLQLERLDWRDDGLHVAIRDLRLDWSPGALISRHLRIAELSLGELHIDSAPSDTPATPPETLRLPLAVDIEKLAISRLLLNGSPLADNIVARLSSDGRQHSIDALTLRQGDVEVSASARLDGAAPLPLEADAQVRGKLVDKPLALSVHASGPLARLALTLSANEGLSGDGEAVLTPFAATPLASARLDLRDIDPAAWQADLPSARLHAALTLTPAGDGFTAQFRIANAQPGELDRQALPFTLLAGNAGWQNGQVDLPQLHLTLPGGGELAGHGDWQGGNEDPRDGRLHLVLDAQRVDAARLLGSLRSTRLNGRIEAEISGARQAAKVDLADARFRVQAALSHAAATVDVEKLEISAGRARLSASGRYATASREFSATAQLDDFDPARFAALPSARLNAKLKASGHWREQPRAELEFALHDSRFRDQPATGQGSVKLAWPRLEKADVQLALAGNTLSAKGAYGAPGDRLRVDIDAPQLAVFGASGNLAGFVDLAGTPARPQLAATLRATEFAIADRFRLRQLALEASAGAGDDDPLQVTLTLASAAGGDGSRWLDDLELKLNGSRRQHQLHFATRLGGDEQLRLEAEGGLADDVWQGHLSTLSVQAASDARNLRLLAPAPLRASPQAWSLGPLQLAGAPLDWRATVQGSGSTDGLRATLQASGSRIGKVEASLQAALTSPWQVDEQGAWQGRLTASTPDLAWLGDVLGEGWQTGGRFDADVQLAGTPAAPRLNGKLTGSGLTLRDDASGLHLADGELDARLDDTRLHVTRLALVSQHRPLPRTLAQALGDQAAAQQAPGKLEISGEIAVDREHADGQAALDIRLDRVGVRQRNDQWVNLSGNGKLDWQRAVLGLHGDFTIDAAWLQMAPAGAPRLSDDVVVRGDGREAETGTRPALDLDIGIRLGRHVLFSGAGLSSRLSGSLRLRASGRDLPRATGIIRTRDGRFDAYGQQLEIERGTLTFDGLPENPALDVRAVRKGLSVEAGVQLSGTAQKPVVRLISDPELPDAEKLSWLVLGHGPEGTGAGDASVLLSAAAGLLGNDAGGLVEQLKRGFGIDELGVRQGSLDGSGRQAGSRIAGTGSDSTSNGSQQILSIGKRLSENVTLGYDQSLGTAESIVRLSIALTREITVVGRAGSDNAVDVVYALTWGLPPSSRRPARPAQADRPAPTAP